MLEHLVEDLRGLELAPQGLRHLAHHGLEHLGDPAVRRDLLVLGGDAQRGPERVEVVEQPSGLVLLHVQPGQPQQPPAVVARVDHLGPHPHVGAVGLGHHLELRHVEAQLVEGAHLLLDLVALGAVDDDGRGELGPQPVVAAQHGVGGVLGIDALVQQPAGLQVQQLAVDVQEGHLHVVLPLARRELVVQLPGLGIHQVRGEGPGVAAEQRVGQGAVLPREARQVQPHQQGGERVEQAVGGVRPQRAGEQRPVGQRELQVLGDQGGLERLTGDRHAPGDDADGVHARHVELLQPAQQLVLVLGEVGAHLLDRVDPVVEPREADHVPGDAARQVHQVLLRPAVQRDLPRQEHQLRLVGRADEVQGHGGHLLATDA